MELEVFFWYDVVMKFLATLEIFLAATLYPKWSKIKSREWCKNAQKVQKSKFLYSFKQRLNVTIWRSSSRFEMLFINIDVVDN